MDPITPSNSAEMDRYLLVASLWMALHSPSIQRQESQSHSGADEMIYASIKKPDGRIISTNDTSPAAVKDWLYRMLTLFNASDPNYMRTYQFAVCLESDKPEFPSE